MECPVCGKVFDDEYVEHLDNGNPTCPHCVAEESEEKVNKNIKMKRSKFYGIDYMSRLREENI